MIFSRVENWDLTLGLVPRRGERGTIHVSLSSREEFSVTFSYSILTSV